MPSLLKLLSRASSNSARQSAAAVASPRPETASVDSTRRVIDAASVDVAAGRFSDALARIDRAITVAPDDGELRFARASTLFSWGRCWEAYAADRDALRLGLAKSDVHVQCGWAAFWSGKSTEALASMREAVARSPHDWVTQFGLATVARTRKSLDEALTASKCAAELNPNDFHCLTSLCATLVETGNLEEADGCARQILDRYPDNPMAWATLGGVLDQQNRFDESLLAYERCEALGAGSPEAAGEYFNRVICLMRAGRNHEALNVMERNFPQHANAQAQGHYALALLTAGRLPEGWEQYEFRWMKEPLSRARPNFLKPPWKGQELSGRTILLRTEQGHGDFIQFIRYAKHVKALGANVLLALREEMRPLAEQLAELDQILKPNEPYPPFDYYANLMSLPRAFGTDLDSIPADVPYLRADPARLAEWAERIAKDDGLNVGIAWAGSPTHVRDKFRSLQLEQLAPLATSQRVRFYSLQKGPASAEAASPPSGMKLVELGPDLHDYGDTAAAIAHLDLIIAVDTSVAHLAGAMGKPVWVLLPDPADFRWMEHREDSPWYPTMRLFRQKHVGVWDDVVMRVAQALQEEVLRQTCVSLAERKQNVAQQMPVRMLTPRARDVEFAVSGLAQVAETRYGFVQYLPEQAGVGASLRRYGEYLQGQLMILAAVGLGGRVIVEAASGIGHHALYLASMLRRDGHVILYENDPRLRPLLRENLSSNGLSNVTVMRRMLRGAQANRAADTFDALSPITSETVDDLRLGELDWLKIGEGLAGPDILGGAVDTMWRTRPKLFVAAPDAATVGKLVEQVRDFGYSCWRVTTPVFNPDNFNLCREAAPDDGSALALLAIPEELGKEIPFVECEKLA